MKKLDLSDNNIEGVGAQALAQMLSVNVAITELVCRHSFGSYIVKRSLCFCEAILSFTELSCKSGIYFILVRRKVIPGFWVSGGWANLPLGKKINQLISVVTQLIEIANYN